MYALHGKYLASVSKGAAKSVLKEDVISYVNALAVPDQANLLRWASVAAPVAVRDLDLDNRPEESGEFPDNTAA